MIHDSDDFATEILQLSPAVAVSGVTFMGFPLNEWVYILTIIYTAVCILSVIKKHWVDPYINNNKNKKDECRQKEDRGDSDSDSASHG